MKLKIKVKELTEGCMPSIIQMVIGLTLFVLKI